MCWSIQRQKSLESARHYSSDVEWRLVCVAGRSTEQPNEVVQGAKGDDHGNNRSVGCVVRNDVLQAQHDKTHYDVGVVGACGGIGIVVFIIVGTIRDNLAIRGESRATTRGRSRDR